MSRLIIHALTLDASRSGYASEPIVDTEDSRLQTRIENPMLASSFGEENLILVARYLLILVEMVDHACICYRTHIMIS
ncbi:hypothetical protein AU210_006096 [Fusarium oxysporum f. sp. radicis-cucumerinum]|uniref:Uncharacterized protein n=1 Tax=Fusarium oxysporum f. sp. radicis-cucumerinum TaxID=327505 RepID=A0A2H3HCA3_FUSOX|nr:hypothetical protein AU210_006096 [Fusarium oxysporum f. sp. radicis-cucumerinum]